MRILARLLALVFVLTGRFADCQVPLRFNLRDPDEAARWTVLYNNDSLEPSSKTALGIRSSCGVGGNAALVRDVAIDAARYNRLYARVKTTGKDLPSGYAAAAVFFNNTPTADILPDSKIHTSYAPGQEAILTFHLTESLLWSGRITRLRLDPLWGFGTSTVSEVWLSMEDTSKAPTWNFSTSEGAAGWVFGEFTPNLKTSGVRHDANGATWSTVGDERVMQNSDFQFDSASAKALRVELQSNASRPTDVRLFWSTSNPPTYGLERAITLPISPSSGFQVVEFQLSQSPAWKGLIRSVIINPGLVRGEVSVRKLEFVSSGAAVVALARLNSVNWITPEKASAKIQGGNYKPLMVLVTKDDNDFSRRIESQLDADPQFTGNAPSFYCVRMQVADPRVTKLFGRQYRIPALFFLQWNASTRQWVESARLRGPDVSTKSAELMASLR